MIPSSLLIKIFGCVAGSLAIISTPTIIYVKKASAARQQEIDASFVDFLKNQEGSFKFHPGETFSGILFNKDWQPTDAEQKILFDNWSTKIKHLPIEFFSLFLSTNNYKPTPTKEFKDICYLQINYSMGLRKIQFISTPFLKTKLPTPQTIKTISKLTDEKNVIYYATKKDEPQTQELKSEEQTQSPYKENMEFFNKIYDTTTKHLNQLGYYPDKEMDTLWSYTEEHCSTDVASSKSK